MCKETVKIIVAYLVMPIMDISKDMFVLGVGGKKNNVGLLTHWGPVAPYGVGDLGQHWFR